MTTFLAASITFLFAGGLALSPGLPVDDFLTSGHAMNFTRRIMRQFSSNHIHRYSDHALTALGRAPTLEAGRESADRHQLGPMRRIAVEAESDRRANTDRSGRKLRTRKIDPLLSFLVSPGTEGVRKRSDVRSDQLRSWPRSHVIQSSAAGREGAAGSEVASDLGRFASR
jgi:hypothetical protein